MNVVVRGTESNYTEFVTKFPDYSNLIHWEGEKFNDTLENIVLFDFELDRYPNRLIEYSKIPSLIVFGSAVFKSLAEMTKGLKVDCLLFGFNSLPGFFNKPLLELTLLNEVDREHLDSLMKELGTSFELVKDRVGLVTPRVICMIINEAYYTVQEGTASPADIDLGMKLGTNYPMGPFEWKDSLGIDNVYRLLEAVYQDTHDERYKICSSLKSEYLRAE